MKIWIFIFCIITSSLNAKRKSLKKEQQRALIGAGDVLKYGLMAVAGMAMYKLASPTLSKLNSMRKRSQTSLKTRIRENQSTQQVFHGRQQLYMNTRDAFMTGIEKKKKHSFQQKLMLESKLKQIQTMIQIMNKDLPKIIMEINDIVKQNQKEAFYEQIEKNKIDEKLIIEDAKIDALQKQIKELEEQAKIQNRGK